MSAVRRVFGRVFSKRTLQMIGAPSTVEALNALTEKYGESKNKYETYTLLLLMDPELNNAVMRLALLTQWSYQGLYIKAGEKIDEREREMLKTANILADQLDFRKLFFTVAKHMLRDGDFVIVGETTKEAGTKIAPLPTDSLTIVGEEKELEDTTIVTTERNIYVLNEVPSVSRISSTTTGSTTAMQKFPENDSQKIYHFAMDNLAERIMDIRGRNTFGVWSISPIESLRSRVLWKQAILITDVLWRYRNVPREVHYLDTSAFAPEKFAGANWEAQVAAATAAAQAYLKDYARMISNKKVDQGYVVGSNVKSIGYAESQRVSYTSPNDLIDQINRSIAEGIGAYQVGRGTYASELVTASYVVLLPNWIAHQIKQQLLALLRTHLKVKSEFTEDEVQKLDIRISLVLDILKGEVARQAAVLAATGIKTIDELREMVGDQPLTDDQISRLVDISGKQGRQGQYAQTILDILARVQTQTEPSEHITPESRRDKQVT